MKKLLIAVLAASMLAIGGQSGNDLFQKALVLERTDGNLQQAIKLYQQIVDKHSSDRKLAAKALMQMAQCYEKLGQAEARKTYELLVQNYADQSDLAADARQRLAALGQPPSALSRSGLSIRKVWTGSEWEMGNVSPDGKYLTMATTAGDVVILNLATGERRQVTHEGDPTKQGGYESIISPDGKLIAYLLEIWGDSSQPNQTRTEIRVAGFDGSHSRSLYTFKVGYISPGGWSPDSKEILVVLNDDATYRGHSTVIPRQIGWLSVADGSLRIIKSLPRRTQVGSVFISPHPSISPDGRWIVYSVLPNEDSQDRDLFLMSADGSRDTPLIQDPADDHHPVWTIDGKKILFISNRAGTAGIWSMALSEGKAAGPPEPVNTDAGSVRWLSMVHNGSCYYATNEGMEDVYIAGLDPLSGKIVSQPVRGSVRLAGFVRAPSWSPDGQNLAYFAPTDRTERPYEESGRLVIRSSRTGQERELGVRNFQTEFPVRWFGDGQSVLFLGRSGERLGWMDAKNVREVLCRLNTQTGESKILKDFPPLTVGPPELSPDGKTIFYWQTKETKAVRLVAYDVESGRERTIHQEVSWRRLGRPAISPDGRQLALLVPDETKQLAAIRLISADGGDAHELYRFPWEDDPTRPTNNDISWTPDGRYVFFIRDSDKDSLRELWRISAQGGEPQRIGLEKENISTFCISADGRRIAFDAGFERWKRLELWVMDNFLPRNTAR